MHYDWSRNDSIFKPPLHSHSQHVRAHSCRRNDSMTLYGDFKVQNVCWDVYFERRTRRTTLPSRCLRRRDVERCEKNTREKTVREGVDHCLVLAHMRLRLSSNEEKLSPGKKDACVAGERSRREPCEELTIKHWLSKYMALQRGEAKRRLKKLQRAWRRIHVDIVHCKRQTNAKSS